jgi:transposase
MPRCIGLDLHKRVLEVCILNQAGGIEARHRLAVSREALQAFARHQLRPDDRLAVEATTNTWPVVEVLRPFVAEVVVSNPLRTKAIAEARVKTDKVDAHTLAQLLRVDYLPAVWQPDAATARLRQLTNQRAGLVADRTAIRNRIHALFQQRLISVPEVGLFSVAGRKWLERVALEADDRAALARDLHLLQELGTAIAELEERLLLVGGSDPRLKLLVTIPGVDVVCAQTLLAALGELDRFRDGDHAASYLGLVPRTKQSAARIYHGPITKAGNGHARWVPVQAAQHLATHPGPLGVFFRRLAHKKNRNVAVVATARKLVVIAYELLRRSEPYRYASPAPTAEKLRRLRLRTRLPRTGLVVSLWSRTPLRQSHNWQTGLRRPAIECHMWPPRRIRDSSGSAACRRSEVLCRGKATDQPLHVLQVERLAYERVGARPICRPPPRRAHEDHRNRRRVGPGLQPSTQLRPVQDRHHDVRDHQVRLLLLHQFERLGTVDGLERAVADVRQELGEEVAHRSLIVDDQDRCHASP